MGSNIDKQIQNHTVCYRITVYYMEGMGSTIKWEQILLGKDTNSWVKRKITDH